MRRTNALTLFLVLALGASIILGVKVASGKRSLACDILIAVDVDTVFGASAVPSNEQITRSLLDYISSLNSIYQSSILQNPPNQNMYLRLQEIWLLTNFVPNCKNESVILSQFSKFDFSDYCLAHLLTYRDFGCVVGLGTVRGLCRSSGNTAFTKTRMTREEKNSTVNTMAHEIGHNFGAEHDGGNSSAYAPCDPKTGDYIMGGGSKEFSTCSIQAMQARLHQIIGKPDTFNRCFKRIDSDSQEQVLVQKIELPDKEVSCPEYPRPDDEECKDNPDPPEPPEPPPEPVCGNGILEHPEECDCGATHEECDDPCCYPGKLSDNDLYLNSTAKPCTMYTHHPCNVPYWSPLLYGLMYSWAFLLLFFIIVGIILWIDWKNKRSLYGHIIFHDEDIRINVDDKRLPAANGSRY